MTIEAAYRRQLGLERQTPYAWPVNTGAVVFAVGEVTHRYTDSLIYQEDVERARAAGRGR